MNYKILTINFIIFFFPFSFIAGNLFTNLNIVILIISTLFLIFKDELKKIKLNIVDKIIILFFIYIFLVLALHYFNKSYQNYDDFFFILKKSLMYLRYLILYFLLRILILNNLIKYNWFFMSCGIAVLFTSLDILLQFFNGKDIFGIVPLSPRKLSGPFGSELIAGGFIQRFYLFIFFLSFFINLKSLNYKYFISIILISVFTFAIILSGNRMSFLMYVFSFFLILILNKKFKKYILIFLTAIIFIFVILYNNNNFIKKNYDNFFNSIKTIIIYYYTKNERVDNTGFVGVPYTVEFDGFYKTWKENKIIGGGLRSYRINCPYCNSHPHNYYFEILTDLGLLGLAIILTILIVTLYKIKNLFHFIKKTTTIPFVILLFVELFPLKTSGSFFSTNNATYIFFLMAFIISFIEMMEKKADKSISIKK